MSSRSDYELIKALLSLYVKFGPDAFQRALGALRDGEAMKPLLQALEQSYVVFQQTKNLRAVRPASTRRSPSPKDRLTGYLAQLRRRRDASMGELAAFVEGVATGKFLPRGAALRQYAQRIGINVTQKKLDRATMAYKIGEALTSRSDVERHELISVGSTVDLDESALQKWANIIVKP